METYHMIDRGDRLIAGVSGGADSVCLLLLLKELSREMEFSLTAVHVEHGIRGEESRRDADFTLDLCRQYDIPCELFEVHAEEYAERSHKTLEEAARELRYRCFRQACEQVGANKIAVAHHANDCAETMLFHLTRGSGIRGLCGITPVMERDETGRKPDRSTEGAVYPVIRPLLCVTREEITAWLGHRDQRYCIDSTNGDEAYSRNRIRGKVIPELMQINPQTVTHMQKTSQQLMEICEYLDDAAWQAGKGGFEVTGREDGSQRIRIFCKQFLGIPLVLQKNLLHQLLAMEAGKRKDISSVHVEQVLDLFSAGVGRKISLPYHMKAERTYHEVLLYKKERGEEKPEQKSIKLEVPGETIWENKIRIRTKVIDFDGNFQKIPENGYTKWIDYGKINFNVRLRTRQSGDYLQIDTEGGHKKLKKYFIDEKIPQKERDRRLLLADGSHIIWVIGLRISEAYKVTQETERILCVQVYGGENYNE